MTGELINTDGLGTVLIYIADKLGLTVEQMYKIYVHAQASMAIIQIAMICVWVVVVIITLKVTFWYCKKNCNNGVSSFDIIAVSIIITIVIAVILAFILDILYNPIIAYMCPEYTALKSLMNDIGNIAQILR